MFCAPTFARSASFPTGSEVIRGRCRVRVLYGGRIETVNQIDKRMKSFANVYLLKKGKNVVYVGCSLQVNPFSRIKSHYGNKDFDSVEIIPCSVSDMLNLEYTLISKHNPKYNVQHRLNFGKPLK